jgi:hypothetical protein
MRGDQRRRRKTMFVGAGLTLAGILMMAAALSQSEGIILENPWFIAGSLIFIGVVALAP